MLLGSFDDSHFSSIVNVYLLILGWHLGRRQRWSRSYGIMMLKGVTLELLYNIYYITIELKLLH